MSNLDGTAVFVGEPSANGHMAADTAASAPQGPARRLRGLRMPVLPSATLLAQVGGGGAIAWGVFDRWGLNVLAILGGAAVVVLGMLRESGRI